MPRRARCLWWEVRWRAGDLHSDRHPVEGSDVVVMASRAGVAVASAPVAVVDAVGLAGAFAAALAQTALRPPWRGPGSPLRNVAVATTRESIRSLMGYMTSLPIDGFRAMERVLDEVSRVVLPPFVRAQGVRMTAGVVGDVPGLWFRGRARDPVATIVYLHDGGHIGTSPSMYAVFTRKTQRCGTVALSDGTIMTQEIFLSPGRPEAGDGSCGTGPML